MAIQDVAGNGIVRQDIYKHFGDDVVYCGGVGKAHVGTAGQQASLEGLGGAAPESFLVFTAIEAVAAVIGKDAQQVPTPVSGSGSRSGSGLRLQLVSLSPRQSISISPCFRGPFVTDSSPGEQKMLAESASAFNARMLPEFK